MTNEEAIEFGKEQLEIFGEDSRMSEFIRIAIKALGRDNLLADTTESHTCRYCYHLIRRDDKHETGFCEKLNISRRYYYPCINEEKMS